MSVNLNAAAFTNLSQNDYSKKLMAENYMQIYQYAAEDFTSHPDVQRYILDLTRWMMSVDQRLAQQMALISTHTHSIPPHMHGVINHSTTTPTALVTLVPVQSNAIKWSPIDYPIFINTTLTIPNIAGNKVIVSTASEGSVFPTLRRMQPIPETLIPKLSPVLQDSLLSSIV